MVYKKSKLVLGIGTNDADYSIKIRETIDYLGGKQRQKVVWRCPFYAKWISMLVRCYSKKHLTMHPTYVGCSAVEDWHLFSNFKSWMETQDWEGKHLDKDILFKGNKIYSPQNCVFVSHRVNMFILESTEVRGLWPIGVCFDEVRGKFRAMCKSVTTGKQKYLGRFSTPAEAHQAWLSFKLEQAYILAGEQTNKLVAKALIDKYKNY